MYTRITNVVRSCPTAAGPAAVSAARAGSSAGWRGWRADPGGPLREAHDYARHREEGRGAVGWEGEGAADLGEEGAAGSVGERKVVGVRGEERRMRWGQGAGQTRREVRA